MRDSGVWIQRLAASYWRIEPLSFDVCAVSVVAVSVVIAQLSDKQIITFKAVHHAMLVCYPA